MLWPHLAATLVRGSAVTACTNVATAPIPGRTPTQLPKAGSAVGADGVIPELLNEQLDPGMVPRAEAALAAARARRRDHPDLEGVQQIHRHRPTGEALGRAIQSALDTDIAGPRGAARHVAHQGDGGHPAFRSDPQRGRPWPALG